MLRSLSASLACLLLGAGCIDLNPKPDPTRWFVLSTLPAPTAEKPAASPALSVGIRAIRLPGYLNRRQIAVRQGNNEVRYHPFAEWGENLDTGTLRVLASNLSTLLHTDQVLRRDWPRGSVSVELEIEVTAFEVNDRGEGFLDAGWRIRSPDADQPLSVSRVQLRKEKAEAATDTGLSVALLSELLRDFSQVLAKAILEAHRGVSPHLL